MFFSLLLSKCLIQWCEPFTDLSFPKWITNKPKSTWAVTFSNMFTSSSSTTNVHKPAVQIQNYRIYHYLVMADSHLFRWTTVIPPFPLLPPLPHVPPPTLESCSPNSSSFCCRGVFISSVSAIWVRIWPIAVFRPVPITIPRALPAATLVPEKRMFFLSCGGGTGCQCVVRGVEHGEDMAKEWSRRDGFVVAQQKQ